MADHTHDGWGDYNLIDCSFCEDEESKKMSEQFKELCCKLAIVDIILAAKVVDMGYAVEVPAQPALGYGDKDTIKISSATVLLNYLLAVGGKSGGDD